MWFDFNSKLSKENDTRNALKTARKINFENLTGRGSSYSTCTCTCNQKNYATQKCMYDV